MQPSLSGRLEFQPSRLVSESLAAAAWADTPSAPVAAPVKGVQRRPAPSFNIAYEQVLPVPS